MDNLLKQLVANDGIGFLWSGNNGYIVHAKNSLFAFDLDLFNVERIATCTLDLELLSQRLTLLMITHEHEDHFSTQTCELLIEKSECYFVIPKSCEQKALNIGIPPHRLTIVEPHQKYCVSGINFTTTRAVHGHFKGAVCSMANMLDCGYIVEICGKTIYQPGDTLLLEEHFTMSYVDVLLLSSTEHNLAVDNSLQLINLLKPHYILPQHHSTYVEAEDNLFWTHGFVNEVYERLNKEQQDRFIILTQEDIFTMEI